MKRFVMLVLTILLVAGVTPGVRAQDGPPPVGIDEVCGEAALEITTVEATLPADQVMALDALLRSMVTTEPVGNDAILSRAFAPAPGAILLVEAPEGRYYAAIGVSDVETCAPLAPDAHIQIGSNTKTMVSAIIYQLQEEGVLSTSDLVSKWLPEEIAQFPNGDQITIDMLLTHTSGLFDYLDEGNPAGLGYQIENDPDVLIREFSPQELVQLAADAGVQEFAPGEAGQWSYTNTGYIMLGQIIEAATGQPVEDVFQERIFTPLGLEDTYFGLGLPDDDRLPQAYLGSPFDYNTRNWNMSQAWAAGAVVSTAEDVARYVKSLYSGALYQNEATLAAMLEPASPEYVGHNENFYYGHGMFYKDGFLGHGGQTLGFETDMGYNPELDATIVMLTNSASNIAVQGVYFVGEALGWTDMQHFIDAVFAAQAQQSQEEMSAVENLTVADITGLELTATSYYDGAAGALTMLDEGESYTLSFSEEGQLAIQADCNMVSGTYAAGEEGALAIELGVTTLAACGPESFDQTYLGVISSTVSVLVSAEGSDLIVVLVAEDGSTLGFGGTR